MSGLIRAEIPSTKESRAEYHDKFGPGKKVSSLRLVDKVIEGDLDLRGMTVRDTASFFNVIVKGDLRADEARFLGGFEARRLIVEGQVHFYSCRFEKLVRIDEGHFKNGLSFDGSDCQAELVLHGVEVQRAPLSLVEVQVSGGLELQEARLEKGLRLDKSTVSGWADFSGLQGESLSANSCVFGSGLELRAVDIKGQVNLSDATVKDSFSLRDAEVGGEIDARRTVFQGRFDGVRLKSGALIWSGTVFEKAASLARCEVLRIEAQDLTAKADVNFTQSHVRGKSLFRGSAWQNLDISASVFDGSVDFEGAQFNRLTAVSAVINGDFGGRQICCRDGVNFEEARIDGDATFDRGTISHGINFSHSVFERRLDLRLDELEGTVDFRDARAAYPNASAKLFLNSFSKDPEEAAGSCLVLRDWLKSQNQYEEMDLASYRLRCLQRRARAKLWRNKPGALLEWLFVDLSSGYGLKPWRVLRTVAAVILTMTWLFYSHPEAIEAGLNGSLGSSFRLALTRFTGAADGVSFAPSHWLATLALAESFCGVFLSALFVGTLTRKLAR
ncbi:MAG: hypothetical protein P1V97_15610 [Planctomycetota bacterium]|nr:hypothetical protein [Planctomycetota bacterium]